MTFIIYSPDIFHSMDRWYCRWLVVLHYFWVTLPANHWKSGWLLLAQKLGLLPGAPLLAWLLAEVFPRSRSRSPLLAIAILSSAGEAALWCLTGQAALAATWNQAQEAALLVQLRGSVGTLRAMRWSIFRQLRICWMVAAKSYHWSLQLASLCFRQSMSSWARKTLWTKMQCRTSLGSNQLLPFCQWTWGVSTWMVIVQKQLKGPV